MLAFALHRVRAEFTLEVLATLLTGRSVKAILRIGLGRSRRNIKRW